jgi:hypothetical protein
MPLDAPPTPSVERLSSEQFVRQSPPQLRGASPAGMPFSHLPTILDPAAARDARDLAQHATPAAPNAPVANPGDLVARALAILAEETEAWRARRTATSTPQGAR